MHLDSRVDRVKFDDRERTLAKMVRASFKDDPWEVRVEERVDLSTRGLMARHVEDWVNPHLSHTWDGSAHPAQRSRSIQAWIPEVGYVQ